MFMASASARAYSRSVLFQVLAQDGGMDYNKKEATLSILFED